MSVERRVLVETPNDVEMIFSLDELLGVLGRFDFEIDKDELELLVFDSCVGDDIFDQKVEERAKEMVRYSDGLIGDDYYRFMEHVRGLTDDITDIYEGLIAPSRKGNTRADLAHELKKVIDEMEQL